MFNEYNAYGLCRCVKQEDKSLSLGFSEVVVALIAFMPGPVLYGTIVGECISLYYVATGYLVTVIIIIIIPTVFFFFLNFLFGFRQTPRALYGAGNAVTTVTVGCTTASG